MYFNSRLWELTRGFRIRVSVTVIIGLLTAASGIGRLAILGGLLGQILTTNFTIEQLVPWIIGALSAVILRAILQYFKEMTAHTTAGKIQLSLRDQLYNHTSTLGISYVSNQRTGDQAISVVDGVEQLETFFGQYLPQLFIAVLTPFGIFAYMIFLDFPTALTALTFALFTLLAPAVFHRWNERSSKRRRKAYGNFAAEFLDSIQGLLTLKSFGQSGERGKHLANRAHEVFRSTMWVLATNAGALGVTIAGLAIGASVLLAIGATRVTSGDMSMTALLIILMLGVEIFRPLRELSQLFHQGMNGLSAAQGIFNVLDTKPIITDRIGLKKDTSINNSTIRFENVTFTYPGARKPSLENLCLEIKKGEKLGLMGESGAGKTSIVKLLMRFYDPDCGSIKIGGINIKDIPISKLRSHIALVSQDVYLFHGTVSENLRIGKSNATYLEMHDAAVLSGAHDFIDQLPQGYETIVGERGIKLSGGQRQRIAMARAMLRDTPILILDEAMSAVDAGNEEKIVENINQNIPDRTTITVAHRLSTIKTSKRIITLEDGKLAESGTQEELYRKKGIYYRLIENQKYNFSETNFIKNSNLNSYHNRSVKIESAHKEPENNSENEVQLNPQSEIMLASGIGWLRATGILLHLIKPWWVKLTLSFFLGIARFVTLISVGLVSALIVAKVYAGEPFGLLILLLFIIAPTTSILHWAENWVSHDMAFRLLSEMRIALFKKIDQLAPAYLMRRRTGDLVSMATQDVETVEYFFAHVVAPAFVSIVVPTAIIITLILFGWPMAIVLLPFLIAVVISPALLREKVDKLGSQSREKLGELNAHFVDTVQGIHEIQAFQQEKIRGIRFIELAGEYMTVRLPFFRQITLQRVYLDLAMGIGGLSVAITGSILVSNGILDSKLLPLITLISMAAFMPISEIAMIGRLLGDTLGSTRRIHSVNIENIPVQDKPNPLTKLKTNGIVDLCFNDVTFSYENTNHNVVKDISFKIESGQNVALVGRSGAGKTTVAHLIMRFWDPSNGTIELGGNNIKNYKLDFLREQIALVAQDTFLFNNSLRENLLIGRPDCTSNELDSAIDSAGLRKFVDTLPDGLSTIVGERGALLSGGQKQRVAICRAFLKDAPFLILDEATSHLDATNEQIVRDGMDKLKSDRTTLVIAHRLSTIKESDLIVVIDQGQIVEQGSHQELLDKNGVYSALIQSQIRLTVD